MTDIMRNWYQVREGKLRKATDDELRKEVSRPFQGEPFNPNFDFNKWTASLILYCRELKLKI